MLCLTSRAPQSSRARGSFEHTVSLPNRARVSAEIYSSRVVSKRTRAALSVGRRLVVVPVSLFAQWQDEIKAKAPGLSMLAYDPRRELALVPRRVGFSCAHLFSFFKNDFFSSLEFKSFSRSPGRRPERAQAGGSGAVRRGCRQDVGDPGDRASKPQKLHFDQAAVAARDRGRGAIRAQRHLGHRQVHLLSAAGAHLDAQWRARGAREEARRF